MKTKILIACGDMDDIQLMSDILEINFRDVAIDRALSLQSFWARISAAEEPYDAILVCLEFITEEAPHTFLDRLGAVNSDAPARVAVIGGDEESRDACGAAVKSLPMLPKPFSLDSFGEVVKSILG